MIAKAKAPETIQGPAREFLAPHDLVGILQPSARKKFAAAPASAVAVLGLIARFISQAMRLNSSLMNQPSSGDSLGVRREPVSIPISAPDCMRLHFTAAAND